MMALDRQAQPTTVWIAGCAALGQQLALRFAAAGLHVALWDAVQGAASAAAQALQPRIDSTAVIQALSDLASAAQAQLVILALPDACYGPATELHAAQELLQKLQAIVDPEHSVFALASCGLNPPLTALLRPLRRPQRVLGLHFPEFEHAGDLGLVEVVQALQSDPDAVQTVLHTLQYCGFAALSCAHGPGLIVQRAARAWLREAQWLLHANATNAATIDAILQDCAGFTRGAFAQLDASGLEHSLQQQRSLFAQTLQDPRFRPTPLLQELVAAGQTGQRVGRGYLHWSQGRVLDQVVVSPPTESEELVAVVGRGSMYTLHQRLHRAHDLDSDIVLLLTDGRTATQRAQDEETPDLVLCDYAMNYAQNRRILLARADQCADEAWDAVVAACQEAGLEVCVSGDVPGLVAMRTLCVLANEAAWLAHERICSAQNADTAIRLATGHPMGPLEWAQHQGLASVVECLDHLAIELGHHYRACPLLRRKAITGELVYTPPKRELPFLALDPLTPTSRANLRAETLV